MPLCVNVKKEQHLSNKSWITPRFLFQSKQKTNFFKIILKVTILTKKEFTRSI